MTDDRCQCASKHYGGYGYVGYRRCLREAQHTTDDGTRMCTQHYKQFRGGLTVMRCDEATKTVKEYTNA